MAAEPIHFYTGLLEVVNQLCNEVVVKNVNAMAHVMLPAADILLGFFMFAWAWCLMLGAIESPLVDFMKRVAILAFVLDLGLRLNQYNEIITETFLHGPDQLMAALANKGDATSTMGGLDAMLSQGLDITAKFWAQAGIWRGNWGQYGMAFGVLALTIIDTAYGFFLMAISKFFATLLIGLGPFILFGLLFQATRGYVNAWVQQLSNFFLIPVLVAMFNLVMMELMARAAAPATGLVEDATVAAAVPFIILSLVSLMALAQVMSVAGALAGGMSISSMGAGRYTAGAGKQAAGVAGAAGMKAAGAAWGATGAKAANAFRNRKRNSITYH